MVINRFKNEYEFLSNFYGCDVIGIDGEIYPSVEHAFQAAKCPESAEQFKVIRSCAEAKKFGRMVTLRSDWEQIKVEVMEALVRNKFKYNSYLKDKLLATGDAYLEEGNNHKDDFWGTYRGTGRNQLGKILMKIREELKND